MAPRALLVALLVAGFPQSGAFHSAADMGRPAWGRAARSLACGQARLPLVPALRETARGGLRMVGSAGAGGGDLEGGADSNRNAQLSSLKKMFYSEQEEVGGPIHDTGLILDMPLCRWSWVLLPGQQLALNVWQPQYTVCEACSCGRPCYASALHARS
jgi:hypothetical protein